MSPTDTPPLIAVAAPRPSLRERREAVSEAFLAGMRRLRRPVRPHAAPALRIFDNWAVWACAVLGA
ncbi:hypothetical protein, partial [Citrobacter koseri]|uniref:hypothetical protein n=1 Tax=Citrobacter koseri TaxID=545 RepID=UPI0013D45B04